MNVCTSLVQLLDGVDVKDLRLRDVRKHFGIVQQNTELFGGTIEENIGVSVSPRMSVLHLHKSVHDNNVRQEYDGWDSEDYMSIINV